MREVVKLTTDEVSQIVRDHIGWLKGWPTGTEVRVGWQINMVSSGPTVLGAELVGVEIETDYTTPDPAP